MQPMRPRFRLDLPFDRDELMRRMDAHLACQRCPCFTVSTDHHIDVRIREDLQHAWSPQLSFEVTPNEEGNVTLDGLFGPNPDVWTMFMAAYLTIGCAGLFGAMFGLSQLAMGVAPWALLSVPATGLLMLVPYALSIAGQRRAADQMEMLRCFLQSSLALPHEPVGQEDCPDPARPGPPSTVEQPG